MDALAALVRVAAPRDPEPRRGVADAEPPPPRMTCVTYPAGIATRPAISGRLTPRYSSAKMPVAPPTFHGIVRTPP